MKEQEIKEEIKEFKNPNAARIDKTNIEVSEFDIISNSNLTEEFSTPSEIPVPNLNIAIPEEHKALISDEKYLNLIDEIIFNIKEDREQVSDYITNMADMVINGGDSTTSTKEALINLVKIKTDLQDKMLKAAELMTRLKLKNSYAYSGPHLNALQQNNFNINSENENASFSRKDLIRVINQAKKKGK